MKHSDQAEPFAVGPCRETFNKNSLFPMLQGHRQQNWSSDWVCCFISWHRGRQAGWFAYLFIRVFYKDVTTGWLSGSWRIWSPHCLSLGSVTFTILDANLSSLHQDLHSHCSISAAVARSCCLKGPADWKMSSKSRRSLDSWGLNFRAGSSRVGCTLLPFTHCSDV